MAKPDIREQLLEAGAKNLREFGYTNATAADILKSYVMAQFFIRMLEETREKVEPYPMKYPIVVAIDGLLAEAKKVKLKSPPKRRKP